VPLSMRSGDRLRHTRSDRNGHPTRDRERRSRATCPSGSVELLIARQTLPLRPVGAREAPASKAVAWEQSATKSNQSSELFWELTLPLFSDALR
jgi:hypothetical protein